MSSRVIAAAALLLVCATTARAQPDTATVRIRFAGSTAGFPPIVITLTRVDPPAQRWVRSARVTDTVTFAHLPPGPYRIQTHGAESADVYRTLVTGLDGTPMPSYAGALDDTGALWDLVAYVRSLRRR